MINISEIEKRCEAVKKSGISGAPWEYGKLIDKDIPALIAHVRELETQLETERLRLAACGVAALGYFTDCKDEYRSASLDDVLRLHAKAGELERQVKEMEADARRYRLVRDKFRDCILEIYGPDDKMRWASGVEILDDAIDALNKEQPNEA